MSEVLSRMIQLTVDGRYLDGVKMNHNGLVISHIFFVDNMLLFLKINKKNCTNIVQLLREYYSVYGQEVNFQKSNVFF